MTIRNSRNVPNHFLLSISTADRTNFKELSVSPNPTIDEIKLNLPDVLNEKLRALESSQQLKCFRKQLYIFELKLKRMSNYQDKKQLLRLI